MRIRSDQKVGENEKENKKGVGAALAPMEDANRDERSEVEVSAKREICCRSFRSFQTPPQ